MNVGSFLVGGAQSVVGKKDGDIHTTLVRPNAFIVLAQTCLNQGVHTFRCAISVPYHSIPYALTRVFSIPHRNTWLEITLDTDLRDSKPVLQARRIS